MFLKHSEVWMLFDSICIHIFEFYRCDIYRQLYIGIMIGIVAYLFECFM